MSNVNRWSVCGYALYNLSEFARKKCARFIMLFKNGKMNRFNQLFNYVNCLGKVFDNICQTKRHFFELKGEWSK